MRPVVIRESELQSVMDALSQYLENAATDDRGEPIETPAYREADELLRRVEIAIASRVCTV